MARIFLEHVEMIQLYNTIVDPEFRPGAGKGLNQAKTTKKLLLIKKMFAIPSLAVISKKTFFFNFITARPSIANIFD